MTLTQTQPVRVAIIGCGKRGRLHARNFAACDANIVALADPFPEAARALAEEYPQAALYDDYNLMLRETKPDMVSICTWPQFHPQNVLDAAKSGVRAIHCEKPMAPSWREAQEMHRVCEEAGVQLTFSHQRRFGTQFMQARKLIQSGAIGRVHRIEGFCNNLFDWGTHWFDMMFFWNEEAPAEWVIGQADFSGARAVFGATVESAGLSYVRFQNEVYGFLATGKDVGGGGCANRILGSEGVIEVQSEQAEGAPLRMLRTSGSGWETPTPSEAARPHSAQHEAAVRDAIECIGTGREPELSSRKALRATELIFATYESARRGTRIMLPMEAENASLDAMLQPRAAS